MGKRKIVVRESAARSIAEVSWFIESKGLAATAEKFVDAIYDFIEELADDRITHSLCRDPVRNLLGLKCRPFKKYVVVFDEDYDEITVSEFLPSKMIKW